MEIWCEAGTCEGELAYALQAADAVAKSGGDALKVQWFRPDTLVTKDAVRYDRTPGATHTTQQEMLGKVLRYDQWGPVIDRCRERGIKFIPSVFDMEAIEAAVKFDLPMLKIASGDITYRGLIEAAAGVSESIVISTGAATMGEVEQAVGWVRGISSYVPIILLACHLSYPTALYEARLGRVKALQDRFSTDIAMRLMEVGYSDHTPGTDTFVPLALLGATVVEKHFSVLPYGEGIGDHTFAIRMEDVLEASRKVGGLWQMVDLVELAPTPQEQAARKGARRSLHALVDLKPGDRLTKEVVGVLRPAGGIEPALYDQVTEPGKEWRAMVEIPAGAAIEASWAGRVGGTLTVE